MTMRRWQSLSGTGSISAWARCVGSLQLLLLLMWLLLLLLSVWLGNWETGKVVVHQDKLCRIQSAPRQMANKAELQLRLRLQLHLHPHLHLQLRHRLQLTNVSAQTMCWHAFGTDAVRVASLRVAYLTDTQILHQFVSRTNSARTWASKARTWIGWTHSREGSWASLGTLWTEREREQCDRRFTLFDLFERENIWQSSLRISISLHKTLNLLFVFKN